jgi:hypothetical protein
MFPIDCTLVLLFHFPEAMDNATPTSAPNDKSRGHVSVDELMPPSATTSFAVTTDPRKAAEQVGEILKARNAERDNIFSGVIALVGYLVAAGVVVIVIVLALDTFGMLGPPELGSEYYLLAVAYFIVESGLVLMSTLPPETFDFDLALDDRRGARRAMTIGIMLLLGTQGLSFPHVAWLGAFGTLVKLIWDESVAGCCRCGTREIQHGAFGFHDEQGRRVHNPTDAGCNARFRPRLTDTLCLCFYGITGLQYGGKYAVSYGLLCHAAAQNPGMAENTSTSNNESWTTPTDAPFLSNRTTLGNVTNSTPMACGSYSFK